MVRVNKLYHCRYSLSYLFVVVTKLCAHWGAKLIEINGQADHVHLAGKTHVTPPM
jgi:REP element-mobilizing transposase RayT